MPGAPLIWSIFWGPELRFYEAAYPPGVGGRGGYPILALILNILGWLALKKCVLYRTYVHICCIGSNAYLPHEETATRMGSPRFFFYFCYQPTRLKGIGLQGCAGDSKRWS